MKLSGELCLHYSKVEYSVVGNGRNTNLSEMLNAMLLEDIRIHIVNRYNGEKLFSAEGKLIKEKMPNSKGLYLYHVGGENLDEVLWNLIRKKVVIDLVNVTKENK